MYPGLKVDLIWDKALQYCRKEVQKYIDELYVLIRLVVKIILEGLILIMQVFDLYRNETLK